MMERYRSSPDIIGILQKGISSLNEDMLVLKHRDHSIPGWIDLALGSSWTAYSILTDPTLGYWRSSDGTVRLRGIIKSGTLYPNVIATLPVGFFPGHNIRHPVVTSTGVGWALISPIGQIYLVSGSNIWADFSSVSFRAEQ